MQAAAMAQQAQQAPRPQVQQYERWKQEWYQQHPNEPLPIFPVLEKMHHGEIIQNMNNDFALMRQRRQAELQHEYQLSKQHQEQINAAQHVTWTAAQWKNWDREYDQQNGRKRKIISTPLNKQAKCSARNGAGRAADYSGHRRKSNC